MRNTWFLLGMFLYIKVAKNVDIRPDIIKHCRDKDRLIGSEENDLYLLVDAEVQMLYDIDNYITFETKQYFSDNNFSNEKDDQVPKIWYLQDRYQSTTEAEISWGMENNMSYNRIHVTPELSLVIKDFEAKDAGLYKCHGSNGQEVESKYNYRLEPVLKNTAGIYRQTGNLSDWVSYHEINLAPVSLRFAVSRMPGLIDIRKMGIKLEIVSEWGPWSPCERCVRKRGYRTRVGMCRVKRTINDVTGDQRTLEISSESTHNTSGKMPHDRKRGEGVPTLFLKTPMWPCRSKELYDEYPEIGTATKDLPEFIQQEKCKKCSRFKKHKRHKFRYKKRYVLAEDAHLTITCPESNMETDVVWKKDNIGLKKGTRQSVRSKDPEPRVLVDTYGTLYLLGVTQAEAGNYTCYVDKVNMLKVKVIVVSRSLILSRAFLRHVGYLGFILLMGSFCYCAGLVITCYHRDKFTVTDYKEIEARENNKADFFD